ncbi:MAG: DUF302 domain-containing protein [Candidatus Latescibacterota bacterium]|nr:MAG: DUF302 domain-containing protein [Candidatus Latescibacterota bacterium]
MRVTTQRSFDDAIEQVTALLAQQGFGVLTEIDVRKTLREKLGVEHRPYKILGACNPQFAHRALEAEAHVGVLLPCNVVVWDEGEQRVVAAMEPRVMGSIIDSDVVAQVADEVSRRLQAVLQELD